MLEESVIKRNPGDAGLDQSTQDEVEKESSIGWAQQRSDRCLGEETHEV